ncbi:catechol 2,3-dioxygenase-like lactoylglutathione lyase family enzyme [Paraburkholderia sp. Clong3]|uniref:VOC family protein n=1 Tax=unclassified Paraburkholderia TaxID=2615204 RepID=UPI00161C1ACC|nr:MULTISPECIES: VOC family protein [unclassified Paraburkholderia]MBB5408259.1 catechol 2,3-dioxygenase-like lactoylglutathione lyase family enzyme [Paraburkholderia sp. HC6.4b]MBB5455783.1 catechol 2,3-dioxygenase-like lactoylglutathione lyase family enzyme [Paraburkholderia sp. Kb1A]MBB5464156.1 catechol 2,3-dioxygenase-like lactoylglutathione lyase family enzyme [Paraburkholderia sp. CI2]MBC8741797.1 glyoxalase [Paraburkholderia sp. UCT31]
MNGMKKARAGLSLSHMGFYVSDMARVEDFYTRVMEFTVTDRGSLQTPHGAVQLVFLSRDPAVHHQIVLASGRPEHLAFNPINQISFTADSLATLRRFHRQFIAEGLQEINPVTHGNSVSIYARDPEGNRLELYIDTPWYVDQPMRVPVDFGLPDAELMAAVERHARTLSGFRPRSVWQTEMAERMGLA